MAHLLNIASTTKTFKVAVVGVGLVGGEFIKQLLAFPQPSPFRLVSLSSSKSTIFAPDGLHVSVSSWKDALASSREKPDLQFLLRELASLVKPGQEVVLVDNTSSNDVAALYPQFLKLGVNIITPNKKAFSSELSLYENILAASLESGAKFLNEATVGAGLPIISTLKDLIATGDTVTKIEGVFSGTMSYIFNEFSTGKEGGLSFSSVVSIARDKGYTEPHPADDLNGADVARKLTILSRFIPPLSSALPAGYQSVSTKSLIPSELEGIDSGDEFIKRLPEFDAQFDQLRAEASKEGKVLRYAGVIDVATGTIKADLEKYPVTHPFATALGGSDNIIMFHTERYGARPLVVLGAGAGAAVTAMGVMSDLFKLV
ncbi:aspartate kinase homoserine dehydrogenase [Lentinus tigrinus ALCF2SS1-7]|uniref:Homoserine dehydrogenase n=1 Tax=Lentinus tigrinus ALCF2SS1-6 TaxID=1328759 RepID=A0A5C2SE60_9APHY|nr:aspartate kinase homoserine dehydrogenase [Lentinus tigrinus ALCF2SS1-6]RPD69486.1 aspartate kinase homoserine dehydrogenase [Lentinus tigrinus ALCF2SS1-7]